MKTYADIVTTDTGKKIRLQQQKRKVHLHSEIYRDLMAILKLILPDQKVAIVGNHVKSIMVNLIELKTGKRPDKF